MFQNLKVCIYCLNQLDRIVPQVDSTDVKPFLYIYIYLIQTEKKVFPPNDTSSLSISDIQYRYILEMAYVDD